MKHSQQTMLKLGYLGLLPFVAGLLMILSNTQVFTLSGELVFVSYSAVILSFLSGVLWGKGLTVVGNSTSRFALIMSNVFALFVWVMLLQPTTKFSMVILLLAAGYLAIWWAEKRTWQRSTDQNSQPYLSMRDKLTAGVVLMHLLSFASS